MMRSIAMLTLSLLAGCGFVSYEDVSSDPEYSRHVGAEYRTTSGLQVYRISMDRNYGPSPAIHKIIPPPGFNGPEVIARTSFPVGSTVRVLAVERCKDCHLDANPRVHATVHATSDTQFGDLEVQADLNLLSSHMQAIGKPGPSG